MSTAWEIFYFLIILLRLNNEVDELAGNIQLLDEHHAVGEFLHLVERFRSGYCARGVYIGGDGETVADSAVYVNGYLYLVVNALALVIVGPLRR